MRIIWQYSMDNSNIIVLRCNEKLRNLIIPLKKKGFRNCPGAIMHQTVAPNWNTSESES